MSRLRRALMALSAAVTTGAAQAALIDNGDYTTDTLTGLDWLDVSITVNQSITFVYSQMESGGIYEGWRYATKLEVATFWTSAGGSGQYAGLSPGTAHYSTENNGLYATVAGLWGATYGTSTSGYIEAAVGELLAPSNPLNQDHALAILRDWADYEPDRYATTDFASFDWHVRVDQPFSDSGSALVRASVPEPASLFLVGAAFVGLALPRRRRSTSAA